MGYEYVWWMHLLSSACLLIFGVYERLQTSPYPLGWIGLTALNAQSLKSISEKAQHSGSWSGDQMYFCNFFVQWDCSLHWTSLRSCCSQSAFSLLFPSPSCCKAPVAHFYVRSLQVSCEKLSVCFHYITSDLHSEFSASFTHRKMSQ